MRAPTTPTIAARVPPMVGPVRFALLLGALGASLASACDGDDAPVVVSSASDVERADTGPDEGVAVATTIPTPTKRVVSFYDALNGADWSMAASLWPTGDLTAARWMTEEFRERSSVACSPGDAPAIVVCDEFVGNDFVDPARVSATFTVRYDLADDVIVDRQVVGVGDEVALFVSSFGDWLLVVDPQLHAEGWIPDSTRFPLRHNSDTSALMARLDQFLAQSDVYPLSS